MKKTLYLMRHAQTLFNVFQKFQGWCDSPLTEKGVRQAEIAGRYFTEHGVTFDYACCATAERASDTLEAATGGKVPYARLKGLRELYFGLLEGKDAHLLPPGPNPYEEIARLYGGERPEALRERACRTLSEVMRPEEHRTVLAVTHGFTIREFCRQWERTSRIGPIEFVPNCAILRFSWEDGVFSLEELITHDFSGLKEMDLTKQS